MTDAGKQEGGKLLACAHCGSGLAHYRETRCYNPDVTKMELFKTFYSIQCWCGIGTQNCDSNEEAIERWNSRAPAVTPLLPAMTEQPREDKDEAWVDSDEAHEDQVALLEVIKQERAALATLVSAVLEMRALRLKQQCAYDHEGYIAMEAAESAVDAILASHSGAAAAGETASAPGERTE